MSLHSLSITQEQSNFRLPEWQVPLTATSHGENEVNSVARVLRSGWWTCGPETEQLESECREYFGTRHAIAVSSGTAALCLAFLALQLSEGEEVVTPALNFVAATNMILHAGAVPRFADVDSINNPVVSAGTLKRAITPDTRGICVMHYGGYPCDMDSIMALARKNRLWVIEDAAHAPGARWNRISCGNWGDIGCFSFFGNKNLSCAEGGLVITGRDDLAQKLRLLRSHGMNSLTWDRFRGHGFSYDVAVAGFNFRMDDLRASLLRVQLRSLDGFNSRRRTRVQWYRNLLGNDARWNIPFEDHGGSSSYHLFTVVLSEGISRNRVMGFLRSRGIQTSIHYPPIHQFTYYRHRLPPQRTLNRTEEIGQRIMTLPLFPEMTREQVELVCASFREAVENGKA
jgi:dTDP-4-amino-4,6-dideoxygalactose transaminase